MYGCIDTLKHLKFEHIFNHSSRIDPKYKTDKYRNAVSDFAESVDALDPIVKKILCEALLVINRGDHDTLREEIVKLYGWGKFCDGIGDTRSFKFKKKEYFFFRVK